MAQRRVDLLSPAVTVVLVHRQAAPVELATVDALLTSVTPPPHGIRVVLVDAAPPESPRAWTARTDRLEVIGASTDLAGGALRNRGAHVTSSPYVAFLDGNATPDGEWLVDALRLLEPDGSIVAVTAPGEGASLSFAGLPTPAAGAYAEEAHDVLYPSDHAAVFRTERFLELGSFDGLFENEAASIDIGWRAWLSGFRVVRSATAGAHRAEAPEPPAASVESVAAFEQRQLDALVTIFRNFDDESLEGALPAAMALLAERGARLGEAHAAAASRALRAFTERLPELQRQRAETQTRRRRTDSDLLRLFRDPLQPASGDESMGDSYEAVATTFGLGDRFGARRRILVATPDVFTTRMAGPAIRAWQIATELSNEHDVTLVTTSPVCELDSPRFTVEAADDARLRELERWADVIVVQGFVFEGRPYLRDTSKIVVVDIYDPLHLEQLELERDADDWRRRLTVRNATAVLNDQLVRGDYFICASVKQRDFWLGQMSAVGRINPLTYDEDETLDSLLGIVPFGLPDRPPEHTGRRLKGVVPGIGPSDEVILWGGGIYNWFDPLTLIEAVDRLRRRRPQVRLFFMGMKHPNPEVAEMRMANAARVLADERGLTGRHVFFNEGWVAYDDRHNFLLEADVGVSTHLDHVETAFSFRTRILDYLWAALPIVATQGDAFADLIDAEGLGFTVAAGDVEGLEAALYRLLDDTEANELCRKRLAAVRSRYSWPVVLRPLVTFCRSARRAPDLADAEMAAHILPPPRFDGAAPARTALTSAAGTKSVFALVLHHLASGGVSAVVRAAARKALRSAATRGGVTGGR